MSIDYPIEQVRNIGIIAHIDAGKTTLTERILFDAGRTYRLGDVDAGTTVTDWMAQERERGITITAAAITIAWSDKETREQAQINIIDTPGHIDFTAEVQRSLRVLDGGVVVFDGIAGVEPQSETVWYQADRYHVPRICFINKLDRTGADPQRAVAMIRERLRTHPVAVQYPLVDENGFDGVVDLLTMKVWRQSQTGSGESETDDIPHRHLEPARIARNEMVEAIVATDEALTHQYLAGHEISPEQLIQALRHAVIADQVTPVLFGSALKNIGVQAVLNAVVRYLPSPADVGQTEGTDPRSGEQAYRCAHPTEPFCALVFKIVSDPWIGRLAYLRVYSGQLIAGDRIYNSTRRQEERINRILQMYAQKREEIETCSAGDIVAVAGLKQAYTGDTICTPQAPILLEPIQFPLPVIRIAVAPNSQIEQEKLLDALRRLADEDPTFEVHYDVETDQTVISGMGELHLEIIVDRLKREYHVGCAVSAPLPAYRETITRRASAEGRYIHQTGGAGHYAIVRLALAPAQPGQGIQFVNQTPAMVLPDNYVAGAERGIRASLEAGELAGFPVTDVRVMITGGRFHEVDSHKQDFEIAGSIALKQAYRHAAPILLEPIMQVVTTVAEDYIGSVTKDFAVRQGKIISIDMEPEERYIVHAEVPLRAMFGYVTTLRSLTSGRGYFSMQYLHYKPVADDIAAVIIAERKPGDRH